MIVVGLDLSLTRAGIAAWFDGRVNSTSIGHGTSNAKTYFDRNRRIVSQVVAVNAVIDECRPIDLAVIEGPLAHGPNQAGQFDRAQLWGGVYSQLLAWKIPTAVVNPSTLKAWATGKGNADKPMMLAAARESWPRIANHDEADAAWLAALGAFRLGASMPFVVTGRHAAGAEKVEWPVTDSCSSNSGHPYDPPASTLSDVNPRMDHPVTPNPSGALT